MGAVVPVIKPSTINLANIMTFFRVLLVPPILILLLYSGYPGYERRSYAIAAGLMFLLAAFTDKIDGYVARRTGQVTRLGKFLDPLADKLLMIPVLFTLWWLTLLPLWVVIVIVARELGVSIIRIYGERRSISFPASLSGKIKMLVQVIVVSVLIFFPGSAGNPWIKAMIYVMVAVTVYSGLVYIFRARRELFQVVGKGA